MLISLLIYTILILIFIHWLQSKPFFWAGKGIPYSFPWPILGSLTSIIKKPMHEIWIDLYNNAGKLPYFGIHMMSKPGLLIKDPEIVKQITIKDYDHFQAHATFQTDQDYDPMGKGVFLVEGEQWKVTRTKMTPYFTPGRIKGMLSIMQTSIDQFVDYITDTNGPVQIHDATTRLAVHSIMSTIFGTSCDSFDKTNSVFYSILDETRKITFLMRQMIRHLSKGLYGFLRLRIFLKKDTETLGQFANEILNQRLQGNGNRPDFLEGMKDLMQKDEEIDQGNLRKYYSDGSQVVKFDRYSIWGHCMMMFAAGSETTANIVAFLFYELAKHPDIQTKARDEINDMIQRTNGQYDFDNIMKLKFNLMIIKESLRKYPILSIFGRKCTKRYTLNGLDIPAGTIIILPVIAFHHDEKLYPEPEKFIPERFSDDSTIKSGTYFPFGLGPRTCIGAKFAETNILLTLCKILPTHSLNVCEKTEVPLKLSNSAILSPKNGIWLNIKPIKANG